MLLVLWPFWTTLKVLPATEICPVLGLPVLFAWMVNLTIPLPLPDEPDAMDIQPVLVAAVQLQPLPALTEKLPLTFPAPTFWLVLDRLKEHPAAEVDVALVPVDVWPGCVMVKVWSPILIWAVRAVLDVFCEKLRVKLPFPVPDFGEEGASDIQSAVSSMLQVQDGLLVLMVEPRVYGRW